MTEIIPTDASTDDIIGEVRMGDEIVISYNSVRSARNITRRGRVTDFEARSGGSMIEIERDDGQRMKMNSSGSVHSIGSDYSYTGELTDIQIER